MIKTNLLPPELQTKRRRVKAKGAAKTQVMGAVASAVPSRLVFVLAVVAIAVVFAAVVAASAYKVHGKVQEAETKKNEAEKKRDDKKKIVEAERKEYEERFNQWQLMNEKKEILAALMPVDRLLWSEKFNMLSNLIPDGVYITGLEITEKTTAKETVGSIAQAKAWDEKNAKYQAMQKAKQTTTEKDIPGPKPKKSTKPIITQTLVIDAVALWDEEYGGHRNKYIDFQKQMQIRYRTDEKGKKRYFKDGFKLSENGMNLQIVPGIQVKKVMDEVAVWAFKLTMTTKPFFDPKE